MSHRSAPLPQRLGPCHVSPGSSPKLRGPSSPPSVRDGYRSPSRAPAPVYALALLPCCQGWNRLCALQVDGAVTSPGASVAPTMTGMGKQGRGEEVLPCVPPWTSSLSSNLRRQPFPRAGETQGPPNSTESLLLRTRSICHKQELSGKHGALAARLGREPYKMRPGAP